MDILSLWGLELVLDVHRFLNYVVYCTCSTTNESCLSRYEENEMDSSLFRYNTFPNLLVIYICISLWSRYDLKYCNLFWTVLGWQQFVSKMNSICLSLTSPQIPIILVILCQYIKECEISQCWVQNQNCFSITLVWGFCNGLG